MSLPNEFTVYGSEETLKPLILQLLAQYYDQGSGGGESIGGESKIYPSYVKGFIYLKLVFKGVVNGTDRRHYIEKSFRLIKEDPKTITQQKLNSIGQLIHTKFDNLTFTSGHDTYTYNHPEVGFNRIWGHFNSELDAKKLFEQMLDIIATSPDWRRLTRSQVLNPGDRFQEPPEKEMQAGLMIRLDRERPIATMKFYKAAIKFPHIRKEIEFVNEFGVSPLLMKELQKYAEPT